MNTRLLNENFQSNYLDNLLLARGVRPEELERYKYPTKAELSDPALLDNCESAAQFIIQAVEDGDKFALIADCDCDGLTSAAVTYLYMKEQWPDVEIEFYIHEGKAHGLSDMVDRLMKSEALVILEPDAGINDKQYHDYLGEAGKFTIVMDHHEYENGGYSDYAICVDNQTSANYPNKALSGVGVAWQVMRMIDRIKETDYAFKYIDLVALGCCADVMSPLTVENRYIFDYGFSHLENPMFKVLCEKQAYSMNNEVNYMSVAFYIAPLLNAAIRSGTQAEKERMYKSFIKPLERVETQKRGHAPGEMTFLSTEVARELTNIKARQQKLIEQYESVFKFRIESEALDENNIIFIELTDKDNFSSELNGLIAMRLASEYKKPVLIGRASIIDGQTKGSMRNPTGSPIDSLKDLIGSYSGTKMVAGHANAAGFGITTELVPNFIEWFNDKTADMDFGTSVVDVNFERSGMSDDIDNLIFELGSHNEFWGGDSPTPVIKVSNLHIDAGDIRVVGKLMDTIQIPYNGITFIKFRSKELANELMELTGPLNITVCGTPNVNSWGGREMPQLFITDIEIKEDNIFEF